MVDTKRLKTNVLHISVWKIENLSHLFSERSVLFPTSIIITSLPLSVRTSSIHLEVCWKELASRKKKIIKIYLQSKNHLANSKIIINKK